MFREHSTPFPSWNLDTFPLRTDTVGSCSMLPRDKNGVVGPDLVVYGTRNLRVADISVIPLQISVPTQGKPIICSRAIIVMSGPTNGLHANSDGICDWRERWADHMYTRSSVLFYWQVLSAANLILGIWRTVIKLLCVFWYSEISLGNILSILWRSVGDQKYTESTICGICTPTPPSSLSTQRRNP